MRKGFTLVELLISISIMGILTVIALAVYTGVSANARDSIRKNDLKILATALEVYYQANNKYVPPITDSTSDCNSGGDTDSFYAAITPLISGNVVPVDPKDHSQYCYIAGTNGASYRLYAKLENCNDPSNALCQYQQNNYTLVSDNLTPSPAPGDTIVKNPPCGIVGDTNNDGQISTTDSDLVLQWDGQPSLSDDQLARGDVNKKDGVNVTDALCIHRYIDGTDSTFGACPNANATTIPGAGCRPN